MGHRHPESYASKSAQLRGKSILSKIKIRLVKWVKKCRLAGVFPHVRGELLDIGCGPNELVRMHGRGIGVDVFDWKAENMLVVEDSSRLPFEAKTFGTVTLVACLNHIPNREAVLHEAHRLLQDDGRMIVTMIGPGISRLWHWFVRKEDDDQNIRGMAPGEVYGITNRKLAALFQKTGFEIVAHKRIVFGLNNIFVTKKS
jgi:SAM-dependent methyltransferase